MKHTGSNDVSDNWVIALIAVFGILVLVNQYYISSVVAALGSPSKFTTASAVSFLSLKSKGGDLKDVDLSAVKSTGH
ncbi:hypothetical protein HZB03_03295, partial [Candidatus Woesearchaeota archaeon]|nr:hypothetical protein [Candidatus Woesearchaeota archaeon]